MNVTYTTSCSQCDGELDMDQSGVNGVCWRCGILWQQSGHDSPRRVLLQRKPTEANAALRTIVGRELDHAIDSIACQRHNDGANLTGNTQSSDLEWLARCLFHSSRLGAGDIRSVSWLVGREQWEELGLTPEAVFGDGARQFDQLTDEQADAWRKLARIVMHCIPQFAERVGHRWMEQAKAIRSVWNDTRNEDLS